MSADVKWGIKIRTRQRLERNLVPVKSSGAGGQMKVRRRSEECGRTVALAFWSEDRHGAERYCGSLSSAMIISVPFNPTKSNAHNCVKLVFQNLETVSTTQFSVTNTTASGTSE